MAQRAKEDIRVKLSAEGQEEVVAAFRRVQLEAEKAGKGVLEFSAHGMGLGHFNGYERAH